MKSILYLFLPLCFCACGEDDIEDKISIRNDDAIKITNSSPMSSQNPCFSPNGEYIVFTRFLDGYNAGPSEIVKIKADGSNEQIIVQSENAGNVCVPFGSWIDDKICFASDRAGQADEIWTVSDDGSNLMQITKHLESTGIYYIEPVFNPQNTRQIVFEHVTGENDATAIHQIAYLDVSTGEVTLLTDGTFDDRLPSWSHDGSKILFQRNEIGKDDQWRVYIAPIKTSPFAELAALQLIYFGESEYTDCSWSNDDAYILSSTPFDDIETPNIWMFPIDPTKAPIRKTFTSTNEDGAPSHSPNGQRIAFESHYGEDQIEPSEIWIINE